MKYGQKLKFGDAHVTPRDIQEVLMAYTIHPVGNPKRKV
jgi:hypothetical protein